MFPVLLASHFVILLCPYHNILFCLVMSYHSCSMYTHVGECLKQLAKHWCPRDNLFISMFTSVAALRMLFII